MQTIYTTTTNFVRHTDNIVDLQAYRRRLALAQEGSLAPRPREEEPLWPGLWEEAEQASPREEGPRLRPLPPRQEGQGSRRARRERRAMALDLCASVCVVMMTLLFSLQLLLG